jgi:hypothetical protein
VSVQEIPIRVTADDMRLSTTLDGSVYVIDLSWSERTNSWFISVAAQTTTATPTPVITGLRLSINWPALLGVTGPLRPPGELLAIDTTGLGMDALHDELVQRVRLYYYDQIELGRV